MRVDFTTFGLEPPEKGKTGRAGQAGASGTAASSTSSTSGSSSGVDQTRFSFDQLRVQSLEAQVLTQPEIRQAKVQPLQQAIGNGEYSVSASQVADAMAKDLAGGSQDLGSRTKS
ncbi:MAG: flagellar biosynthesis anti-sigma factor FlgM [Terriglobales bacterium]